MSTIAKINYMSELSITTTQNVNINFTAADVGERISGHIIDLIVRIAYAITLYLITDSIPPLKRWLNDLDNWEEMAVWTILMLPALLYTLVLESLWEGQTIGKKIIKIRVIKIDGYQASFGDYLIRWILAAVDVSLMAGIPGLIAMLVTDKVQRLGDMAAGTAVITLKSRITIDHTILRNLENNYVPVYPMVIKLSDNDIRIIRETYDNSLRAADFQMMEKLQDRIEAVTGVKSSSRNATAFVDTVIRDYNFYTQNM